MRALLISLVVVGVLVAGCASTEIINDPGRVDSLMVGRFTTRDPVDNELIRSYLRKELSKRGFQVVDDSPYVLTGTIDVNLFYAKVREAKIVLTKDSVEQIIWRCENDYASRREFARHMAERITKALRE